LGGEFNGLNAWERNEYGGGEKRKQESGGQMIVGSRGKGLKGERRRGGCCKRVEKEAGQRGTGGGAHSMERKNTH